MVKTKFATFFAQLAPVVVLWSCAAPKAIVVELPPAPKSGTAATAAASAPVVPAAPDDGIRLPDMLAMPGDGEFRATTPNAPKAGSQANAVVSRPPTDPPPRPKPQDQEKKAE